MKYNGLDGVLTFKNMMVAISGILRGSEKATATAQFSVLNATCESAHGEFYNTRASRTGIDLEVLNLEASATRHVSRLISDKSC